MILIEIKINNEHKKEEDKESKGMNDMRINIKSSRIQKDHYSPEIKEKRCKL